MKINKIMTAEVLGELAIRGEDAELAGQTLQEISEIAPAGNS